jgi:hypothetical protein
MATVLLERAEAGTGHKVLLRRSYVHALLDYLQGVDGTKLAAPDAAQLVEFLKEKNEEHLVGGLLVRGSMTKEKGPLGTRLAIASKPDSKKESPWLQILLELGPEAMSELLTVDPLLGFDGDEAEIPGSVDPEDST